MHHTVTGTVRETMEAEATSKLTEIAHLAPLIVILFLHATPSSCFDVADHNGFLLSAPPFGMM
ncbi:hypothetical protein N7519_003951 [Penicillium mononematosum]|uniref:uncharacterized protein n=1 Tax=Penicillium mononematosum TaxID=268346 RepID=UPI0025471CA6|nr:uncharacterized protein N7519_003951 [Penicillium mononematosum]KAJ6189043.1 hypothetical protein N7519_003951 [Penicillium mononematosum]